MQPVCLKAETQKLKDSPRFHYSVPLEYSSLADIESQDFSQKGLMLVGPGKHFGLHVAEKFGCEGFKVGLIARSEEKLSEIVSVLEQRGVTAYYACADVRDVQQLQDAFEQLSTKIPQFQCLIYNVKHSAKGNGLKLDPTKLTETFEANVSGAVSTIQVALPIMKGAESLDERTPITPTIILTGGGYKDRPDANKLALSIGKSGIHTVFTTLRELLSYHGISLKTLVIDGVVRVNGSSLRSDDIAEQFWKVFASPSNKHFFRYSEKSRSDSTINQLELPI